jgi:hypothetical protein
VTTSTPDSVRTWYDVIDELSRCSTAAQARALRPDALPPRGAVIWAIGRLGKALDHEIHRDPRIRSTERNRVA